MGAPALFAILDGGAARLFQSHWGALSIPEDIFWGADHTEEFILRHDEAEQWPETGWVEAGVALNKDRKSVAFFGSYGPLCLNPHAADLQDAFTSLVRHIWGQQGWEVHWVQDVADLAEHLGMPGDHLRSVGGEMEPLDLGNIGARFARRSSTSRPNHAAAANASDDDEFDTDCSLLSIKQGEAWVDRVLDADLPGLLVHGPHCLPHLEQLPTFAEMLALLGVGGSQVGRYPVLPEQMLIGAFATLDVESKTLRVTLSQADGLGVLRSAWVGWSVVGVGGGLGEHLRLAGRAVPDALRPLYSPPSEEETVGPRTRAEVFRVLERALVHGSEEKARMTAYAQESVARDVRRTLRSPSYWWQCPKALVRREPMPPAVHTAPGLCGPVLGSGPSDDELRRRIFEDAVAAVCGDQP
jgi:hypothetical protein